MIGYNRQDSLGILSDELLAKLHLFMLALWIEDPRATNFSYRIAEEAENREWPRGWWEDPSIVIGLESEDSTESSSGRQG